MKKAAAIILFFLYLGYVTGMTLNTYNSGNGTPCSDICTTANNYDDISSSSADNCSHYEHYTSKAVTLHHHVSATGKVKQPRSPSSCPLLFADPTLLPEHVYTSLLLHEAEPLSYTIPIFLKNGVLRL